MAVHNDKVFVADSRNRRVSVFHLDGQFINIIGSGQLKCPYDVAVTTTDQLLVADYNNSSISRFTLDGTFVGKFGDGQLKKPAALTIDLYGFILVTEYINHRVSIFDQDGIFVHSFGSSGSAAGQFSCLYGISVSPNNGVYVTDCDNKRVQIF